MKLNTEGVFVLASSKGLVNEYKAKNFDYSFPEGLQSLLDENRIIALTTSDSDDLDLEFRINQEFPNEGCDREISMFLTFDQDDELLILSHASFTMICDQENGDYMSYAGPIEKLKNLDKGTYKVKVCVKRVPDEEDDEFLDHFKLSITLKKVPEASWSNKVFDLTNE